jgi:hypothetical protein
LGLTAVLLPELLVLLPAAGGIAGRLAGACFSLRDAWLCDKSLDTMPALLLPLDGLHPAVTTVKSSRAAQHLKATLVALCDDFDGFDLFIYFYRFAIECQTTLASTRKGVREISAGYSAGTTRLWSQMNAASINASTINRNSQQWPTCTALQTVGDLKG